MDVKTLCLGLLSRREACGYELKKEFESLFKHFFPAGYGSIYPALADLADAGLVDCEQVPQDGKPDRKVYRITDAGQRAFAHALNDAQPHHKLRSEFLATALLRRTAEAGEARATARSDRVDDLQETLAHIERIRHGWEANPPAGAEFVAGFGAALAQAAADYIENHGDGLLADTARQRPAAGASPPHELR